jgi:branched-subunit amino acid transport protein
MTIWLTICGMTVVTIAVRALPLLLLRGEPPMWLGRWLGLVPVAVFTALVLRPLVVSVGPAPHLAIGAPLVAGLAGALVAWRTSNVMATIVAGMGAYWALRLLGLA